MTTESEIRVLLPGAEGFPATAEAGTDPLSEPPRGTTFPTSGLGNMRE